ncbi:MAG TPA: hypothetical protein PL048_08350, partial [Leptospiraceae bacterium]|nr:hypothetical protein [Leptospiraceae bacterium]
ITQPLDDSATNEYTALQSFYQDNRELAAQNGFDLPSDNKNSDSSIADAVYNASQIFLGALGISTLGLGLLNRTGAGTGGSPSPDPRSPIPETEVRPNRREEGDGGETGGEGANLQRNPNEPYYDILRDHGVLTASENTLSYEEEHRLEDAKAVINDLNKNGIGITAALQQAVSKIPDGPDAEKQRRLLIDAAVQMQISNVTDLNKMKDLLTANENSGGLYEPEDLKKVAEALLMKQKTLADVMTVGPALEKLLWNSGADTSEFWKTATATALKKIESGSPIPKDFISSFVFRDMPEDAKAGLQNIAVNAELKQDFSKQLSNLKKQNLDAFLAGYDKLNSVALERADRVPTAGSDLDKALADKAGASLENTMKLKGTDAAKLAKEKILASLGNSPSAQAAVETRFKDVEQNYLKEKAVSEMLKAKSGLELADRYNDVMARENLDPGTKQALKESFSTISGNVLYSLYKTGGTEAAEKFINEIRNSSQDMHTDIGIKMQEKLGKLLIENSAKTGEGTLQNLNEAVNRLKNDTDFKNLSPSEQADAVNRLTSAAEDRILSMARETAGKGDSDTNVNAVKELRDAMKNSSEYKFSEQKINELENVFKKAEARNMILTKFDSFANLDSKRIDTIKLEETKKIAAEFLVADQLKKNRELLIDSLKSLPKEDADIRDRVAKNEQNERKALEDIAKKVDSKLEYLNLQVQSGGLLGNSDPYSIMDKNLSNLVKDSLISYSSDGQNATLNEKELQRLFPKKEDADAVKKMMESGDPKIAETVYSKLDPKLIAETAALLKNDSRFDSLKGLDPNSAGYKNLLVSIALEKWIVNSEKAKILKDRTALQNKMSLMEKDLKTMFKTDAKGELIYENGAPVEDPEKIAELEKKKADEFAASQQKKINDLKIAAAAESEINRLTAIPPEKRPDNYDSDLKFWTDMKNQYDFSPSNLSVNDIKVQLEVQRKELTKQINSLGDGIDVAPNHLLLQNGKPIEDLGKRKEILDKLYQSLKGSPNADLAKMMAVNTIEKTALNINGTVVERQKVTVYGQEIY